MRNGLRRWQAEKQQEAKKLDKPSAASEKSQIQVGIPTTTVSLTAIVGLLAAYTQFLGYSFFTAKMEAVGFRGVYIELNVQQSLNHALEAFVVVSSKLVDADLYSEVMPSFYGVIFAGFIAPFVAYLVKRYSPSSMPEDNAESWSKLIGTRVFEKIGSFRFAMILAIPSAMLTLIVSGLLIIFLFILIMAFWLYAALGNAAGNMAGKDLINKGICQEFSWSDNGKNEGVNVVTGCNTIKLKNGHTLKGFTLYRQDGSTFFLANDGAYEIDNNGSVSMFAPFHKRPKEINDSDKGVES